MVFNTNVIAGVFEKYYRELYSVKQKETPEQEKRGERK